MNLLAPVSSIMSEQIITVSQFDPLSEVDKIFKNNSFHHIPVIDELEVIGIISKSDLLLFQRGFNNGKDRFDEYRLKSHTVAQIMTKGVATLDKTDRVNVALEVFKENLFHALPVVENKKLVGMVTTYDIISHLADDKGAVNQY